MDLDLFYAMRDDLNDADLLDSVELFNYYLSLAYLIFIIYIGTPARKEI